MEDRDLPVSEAVLTSATIASLLIGIKPEQEKGRWGTNNPFYEKYSDELREVCVYIDRMYYSATLVDIWIVDDRGNRVNIRDIVPKYKRQEYRIGGLETLEYVGLFEMDIAEYVDRRFQSVLTEHERFEIMFAIGHGEQNSEIGKQFAWCIYNYVQKLIKSGYDNRIVRRHFDRDFAVFCVRVDVAFRSGNGFIPLSKHIIIISKILKYRNSEERYIKLKYVTVTQGKACVDFTIYNMNLFPPWAHLDLTEIESRFPGVREFVRSEY